MNCNPWCGFQGLKSLTYKLQLFSDSVKWRIIETPENGFDEVVIFLILLAVEYIVEWDAVVARILSQFRRIEVLHDIYLLSASQDALDHGSTIAYTYGVNSWLDLRRGEKSRGRPSGVHNLPDEGGRLRNPAGPSWFLSTMEPSLVGSATEVDKHASPTTRICHAK